MLSNMASSFQGLRSEAILRHLHIITTALNGRLVSFDYASSKVVATNTIGAANPKLFTEGSAYS